MHIGDNAHGNQYSLKDAQVDLKHDLLPIFFFGLFIID